MKTLDTTTLSEFFSMTPEELYKLKSTSREYIDLIRLNIESHPEELEHNAIRYKEIGKYESLLIMVHLRLIALTGEASNTFIVSKNTP